MIESLEHRQLLAATLTGNILTVTGTDRPDRVQFSSSRTSVTVFETPSGGQTVQTTFTRAQVAKIVVRPGPGADLVSMGRITIPADIDGSTGTDTIGGGFGNDTIRGGGGNDSLFGSEGRDILNGGSGADIMRGGLGKDTVDYNARTANLTIGLGTIADDGELNEGDNVFLDVEVVVGGAGADRISTRGTTAVEFFGRGGNDTLIGGEGADLLAGEDGNDSIIGNGGNDIIQARDGRADTINGGGGRDSATFDDGTDTLTNVP